MNEELLLARQKDILERLSMLPRKMLQLHGRENVIEFVLYELCHQNCLNIDRAAYFVDNPDFDCLKGVAGHAKDQQYPHDGVWVAPEEFSAHMRQSSFNNQVRGLIRESAARKGQQDGEIASGLAQNLNFARHGFYSWPMKHDNHGIFIYERAQDDTAQYHDRFLPEGVCLLSFCPIF